MPSKLQSSALWLLLLACSEAQQPGALSLSWRMRETNCAESGLVSVRAELYSYTQSQASYSVEGACSAGRLNIKAVDPGEYSLRLMGLDAEGCWTYTARKEDLKIEGKEKLELERLSLSPRLRPLQIDWLLPEEQDCQESGLSQVRIIATLEGRVSESFLFLCEGEQRQIGPFESGELHLEVQGLDAQDEVITRREGSYPSTLSRLEPCAELIKIQLPLCRDGGCEKELR